MHISKCLHSISLKMVKKYVMWKAKTLRIPDSLIIKVGLVVAKIYGSEAYEYLGSN